MELTITKTTCPKQKPADESKLGFGKVFTDHMMIMDYDQENGWHNARIVPFGDISMHPAATVFHYGAEIFEGLKAYRRADGKVQLFRPEANFNRMNDSAERLCLPQLDVDFAVESLKKFVELEQDWVPHTPGASLYLRPFMFGADPFLGLHTIQTATYMVIASPSGDYYPGGMSPVKIMIEDEDVRAVRGGTGYAKCGGNYAASTRAGAKAETKGFSQVLWLDGVERKYVEEVGSMNVMFKIDGVVYTPELLGSVLPGVTRRSCLQLMRDWGMDVVERPISVDELFQAAKEGRLEEAWGTGTAAVISPIGLLSFKGEEFTINNNEIGPVTQKLYDELTGIQWGRCPDPYGWVVEI